MAENPNALNLSLLRGQSREYISQAINSAPTPRMAMMLLAADMVKSNLLSPEERNGLSTTPSSMAIEKLAFLLNAATSEAPATPAPATPPPVAAVQPPQPPGPPQEAAPAKRGRKAAASAPAPVGGPSEAAPTPPSAGGGDMQVLMTMASNGGLLALDGYEAHAGDMQVLMTMASNVAQVLALMNAMGKDLDRLKEEVREMRSELAALGKSHSEGVSSLGREVAALDEALGLHTKMLALLGNALGFEPADMLNASRSVELPELLLQEQVPACQEDCGRRCPEPRGHVEGGWPGQLFF